MMIWLRVAVSRLIGLFRKGRLEQQLDEELRSHVQMRKLLRSVHPVNMKNDECRLTNFKFITRHSSIPLSCLTLTFLPGENVPDLAHQFLQRIGFLQVSDTRLEH